MVATADIPGLRFAVAPAIAPQPLRSDVAGFIGPVARGPIGVPVRVVGWREFLRVFGPLVAAADTPYAIRGYFANEGEIAHVVRVAGDAIAAAAAVWTIGATLPPTSGFLVQQYAVTATSPGAWANHAEVEVIYRLDGLSGAPELDLVVRVPDEPVEQFTGVPPARITELGSRFVTFTPIGTILPTGTIPGPRRAAFSIELVGGLDAPPVAADYQAANLELGDVPEVALVVLPDLHRDLASPADRLDVLGAVMRTAADAHDRLVVIDVPADSEDPRAAVTWLADLRAFTAPDTWRAAACYHPRVWVPDPLGGVAAPQRAIGCAGPVAGAISRLDRERGAHHTPANAPLLEAVDVTHTFADAELALLGASGIDPLICWCGRGLQIWGDRTVELADPSARFVAHRRLVHRLVRAIRRVAEPLVFDGNTPVLWFALTRAITTVLLEAFRAGALAGDRPEQAFSVQCDATTNPPSEIDEGRCVCLIGLAPAVPMELITLRIAVAADGHIEVT